MVAVQVLWSIYLGRYICQWIGMCEVYCLSQHDMGKKTISLLTEPFGIAAYTHLKHCRKVRETNVIRLGGGKYESASYIDYHEK